MLVIHASTWLNIVTLVRELGPHWRMITFTSLLYEMVPHTIKSILLIHAIEKVVNKSKLDGILQTYLSFVETIYSHHVENAYTVKRLIPVCLSQAALTSGQWLGCSP
jgi:hypothetical protein